MTQLKIVFGQSMTMEPIQIRHYDLIDRLNLYNKIRRRDKQPPLCLMDYCVIMNINYLAEVNEPLDKLEYYQRFSKRTYNKS